MAVALDVRIAFDRGVTIYRAVAFDFRIGVKRSIASRFEGTVNLGVFQVSLAVDCQVLANGDVCTGRDVACESRGAIDGLIALDMGIFVNRLIPVDRSITFDCGASTDRLVFIDDLRTFDVGISANGRGAVY